MEDPFVFILLISMLLAAISVAVLWYWWSGGDEEKGEESVEEVPQPVQVEAPSTTSPASEEPTIGDFLGKLRQNASSLLSGGSGQPSVPAYPAQTTLPTSISSPVTSGGAIEVMRVLRDLADGSLVVEMDGQRYHSLNHIADPQVQRRFLGNAQALAQFARLSTVGDNAFDLPPGEEIAPRAAPEAAPPPTAAAPPPPPPPPPPPAVSSTREAESMPRRRGLFGLGGSKEEEEIEEPKSMAEEIEELLQYRLTLDPNLARRSIHIRPAHHGNISIEVDGQSFEGIGDIRDETVRDFIQAVIQEWEARQ